MRTNDMFFSGKNKCKQSKANFPGISGMSFRATPAGDLRCNICGVLVKFYKKFFVEIHQKKQVTTRKIGHEKQISLQLNQVNFKEQAVSSLLAADIPLHELNHPYLKSLFATMEKVLPLETAARACVAKLASQKEQIQQLLCDKKIFNCGRSRGC